ncbi:ATP phosphoribosyltransferase regulatory subunit [Bacillaceae bacterium Marseille-Q3522]|nr:ATP phosphoribosyltransferase regulatory subunit [Bacillaceae bacterium Marseille-Q3522]
MFEKPLGMRDTLPELYETKYRIRSRIQQEMKAWGYRFIDTPTLEYYETVGAASAILDQKLFKLLDQQGHTLVLRPDMTAPIARVAAAKLLKANMPLRLAYSANVFRAQQREGGRPAEFEQIGIECIGDRSISADGEGIALMAASLKRAGLEQFQISVGHIGFVHAFFRQFLLTDKRVQELMQFLYEKNYVGYREYVGGLSLPQEDKRCLLAFLTLKGGVEVIDQAYQLLKRNEGKQEIAALKQLWGIIVDLEEESRLKFDLTLVSHMSYYTGIVFEIYAGKVGFPIGNGGRYDLLLKKFGKMTEATGFAIRLDRLLEAIGSMEKKDKIQCILYDDKNRREAYRVAKENRRAGKMVVLQNITGVDDIKRCAGQYDHVLFLTEGSLQYE